MEFTSITYGLLLLSVLGIYWSVQREPLKLLTLLVASLVFYCAMQVENVPKVEGVPRVEYVPILLILLLLMVVVNFRLGLELGENVTTGSHTRDWQLTNEDWQFAQQDWGHRRFKLLWLGIIFNVLLLFSFKYIPFFLETVRAGFHFAAAGQSATWVKANLIAPLGLSFFCFECIAYLVDVYRGAPATPNLLQFATYKLFFAKLVSGPITRYHPFIAQLKSQRGLRADQGIEGLWLIGCGAVKKVLLADRLGIFVDISFNNLQRAGSGDLWLATFAYGLQIYLNFSGYVDIVRGSAMLLGFNLPENFDFPYFSTNIADFWRRWHITLGDWLRNYLYFPLGGSRSGLIRTCVNLMLVMLIAGIWHGAAWGFVVWGGLHGLALVVHRLTESQVSRIDWLKSLWRTPLLLLPSWFLTQAMVFSSWIFFRLPDLKESGWVVQHLWGHGADTQFAQKVYVETLGLEAAQISFLLWLLAALMGLTYLIQRQLKLQLNWPLKLMLVPLCFYASWILAPKGDMPFIYFDF
ncbi:membrane-bound O-acyltransferase family protein [Leptolyngbya sp. 'hensonii']|uniref:MBOAT family O-acyltransferase n=1 Tax=Leptolyngbya sp. 'hensonii' TaxID=1922337 RepID=UPI00094FAE35|nr:MBOAT family O-acyltransferase [Leptolyngbya sp. 'hensonii']OLP16156.1 membrane-bound O-acyltransferase family protein [Leptolyngbya sp. 'hensonii']